MKAAFAAIIVAALSMPCAGAAEFADVLNVPGIPSALALSTLQNGLAMAGTRLVSVGQRGHILYSDNQGKSWAQAAVPVSSDIVAVHFPSPQKGWAVGHDGVVLHSSNGGAGWSRQFDGRMAAQRMQEFYAANPSKLTADGADAHARLEADLQQYVIDGPDKPFLDVWFENDQVGFIVGSFNLIFRTSDGGKTWLPWYTQTENPKGLHLYAIRPVGQDLFIVGEQGLVLKLDRAAERFRAVDLPYNGSLFGIVGNKAAAIAFGLRGNVFRTTNAGKSWQKVETEIGSALTAGCVAADGRIFLVSQTADILVSTDDGLTFSRKKMEKPMSAGAVIALQNGGLLVAGTRGLRLQSLK